MSLMPEFIFRAVIARGMRTVRNDSRFLDQLFRNLDQQSAQQMRTFIRDQRIYLDVNYPRTDLKLPAIIILLKSEQENTAYLNDNMGVDSIPDEMTYDDYSGSDLDVLGGAASASTLTGIGPLKSGPHQVAAATNNTVRISESIWRIDQFRVGTHYIEIVSGTGAGQQRRVASNNQNTIMADGNWSTNPDGTSIFVIRAAPGEIIGEPSSLYTREAAPRIERLGSLYSLTYQIQIITQNPELTIYLHAIIKAIFTLSRLFLEKQGIINMSMSATDFVPRAEYQPDHAYMRALEVSFLYPFDVFVELQDLANALRVVLEDPMEVTLSDVTLSLEV
jgi:hypothetical protein